ncbi:MAG TPA: hypothetical protein DIW54_09445 [Chitinophagaceae bacterium]|nr:hypothetical protein [Chitinophagaceae bacterium]HCT23530.1 hypothetical protein [Chitinophagaceae bacterium]
MSDYFDINNRLLGNYWLNNESNIIHQEVGLRLSFLLNPSGGWTAYANDAAELPEDFTQHKTIIRLTQHPFLDFAHIACDWIFYTKQAGEIQSLITAELCIVFADAAAQTAAMEWIVAHYQKAGGLVVAHSQASIAITCDAHAAPDVLIKKMLVNHQPALLLTTAGAFYSA